MAAKHGQQQGPILVHAGAGAPVAEEEVDQLSPTDTVVTMNDIAKQFSLLGWIGFGWVEGVWDGGADLRATHVQMPQNLAGLAGVWTREAAWCCLPFAFSPTRSG